MKKLFATLSAVLMLTLSAQSQIVINEVLYNIPGAGEDEEFIELYNAGTLPVNMMGYTFTQGINFTFGNVTIPAGGYYVIALDSAAFHTAFGMAPDAVNDGGSLSNGGEDITIYDATGTLVDSIDYENAAPWPGMAVQGKSYQLCDPMTDNGDGANWGSNNIAAGVNGQTGTDSLYCTPGAMNMCDVVVPPGPVSYPLYTFDQINDIDANGVADSMTVTCELRGVAHCIDFRGGSGLDFVFASSDNSAGIRVFDFTDVDNYSVQEGDSLHIWGEVRQFSGLLQFDPDSIAVISQGNATANAMMVTSMSEMTENRFVMLSAVHLVDTAEWTGMGPGFNVWVTDGSADTVLVRIDNDVDLYSQPAPLGTFDMMGWGSQFDNSAPHDQGYQLMPCGMNMIVGNQKLENNSHQVAIFPNPTATTLNVQSDLELQNITIYNTLGQTVLTVNNINNNTTQVNTSNLENGVYVIAVTTENKVMTKQIQVLR